MNAILLGGLAVLGMFLGMLLMLEIGRRLAGRHLAADSNASKVSSAAIDGAVFGLMGLLLAFTFSGAAARFDARRALAVEEANDIGTAWLRLDLLPASAQPALRAQFRSYVDARLASYQKLPDLAEAQLEQARYTTLQDEIWNGAVAGCRESGSAPATLLLLPALNQMIDITTTRTMATRMHPPAAIYVTLVLLVLLGSSLAGYGMGIGKSRNWFYTLTFALIMTFALYVILDFEFPRLGFIRIDAFDRVLVDLRQSMGGRE